MKKIFGWLIAGVVGVSTGIPIGWFLRKKIAEIQFVETTAEEQEAAMIANGDAKLIPVNKDEVQRPADIQKAIDGVFSKAEVPENLREKVGAELENEQNREAGIRQIDTQKEQYWKMHIASKYDTRSNDIPDDVTILPEETQQFVDEIEEEYNEDEHFGDGKPIIEAGSLEDWEHWISKSDGAYDCEEDYWFENDDTASDPDGNEIANPDKYFGFNIGEQFRTTDDKMTGDPDVRIVYNHRQHAIFKLTRKHTSFSRLRGMEEYGSDYTESDGDDSEDYLRSRY